MNKANNSSRLNGTHSLVRLEERIFLLDSRSLFPFRYSSVNMTWKQKNTQSVGSFNISVLCLSKPVLFGIHWYVVNLVATWNLFKILVSRHLCWGQISFPISSTEELMKSHCLMGSDKLLAQGKPAASWSDIILIYEMVQKGVGKNTMSVLWHD